MVDEVTERIRILLDLEKNAHDRAAKQSARTILQLEKAYDPLSRAVAKQEAAMSKLSKEYEAGKVSADQYKRIQDQIQAEFDQTTDKIERSRKALAANSNEQRGIIGIVQRNGASFQQLGYQVGDFAVQVGNGTSALTAFAQQGSQVLGVLGPWGALAGAAVAIGAPLAGAFLRSGDEAKDAADKVEDLVKATDNYVDLAEEARRPIQELRDEYGGLADEVKRNLDIQKSLAGFTATRALESLADDVSRRFGDLYGDVLGEDGQAAYQFEKTFRRIRKEFDLTGQEAQDFMNALRRLGEAEGPREIANAARDLQDLMVSLAGSAGEAGERFGETFTVLGDLIENAADQATAMTSITERMLDVWRKLEEPAKLFADQMARALGFARGLEGINLDSVLGVFGLPDSAAWMSRAQGMQSATDLIRQKEGFIDTAKWDNNHFRVGYGSDTTTDAQGNVHTVTEGMTVSIADAERDLQRRIGEYFNKIIEQVGIDRFNAMAPEQQGALASLLHNYGAGDFAEGRDLGKVLEAVRSRNDELVAQRIVELGSGGYGNTPTGNALRARRREEARAFGGADATIAAQTEADRLAAEQKRKLTEAEREREQATKASQTAIDSLRGSTSDAAAAEFKHAEALKIVDEALRQGQITQEEAAELRQRMSEELDQTLARIAKRAEKDSPFQKMEKDVESLTESLLRTAAAGGNVGEALRAFLMDAAIKAAASNLSQVISSIFTGGGSGGGGVISSVLGVLSGKRAGGGSVQAGGAYLVNENTPNSEVFVPSRSGAILNVSQAQAALRGAGPSNSGQGGGVTLNPVFQVDARGAQRGAAEEFAMQLRRAYPQLMQDAVKAVRNESLEQRFS
ncbi:glycoside hydrolase family protein [Salipiger thiooxidans]|uniref:glycoside hydrolase family protein n=1 Tax=Salipiger thiooxidans TaxID=282683 RepID=UPI001CFA39B8|nr:hypothetical protein [Salipiger thiooxidans]